MPSKKNNYSIIPFDLSEYSGRLDTDKQYIADRSTVDLLINQFPENNNENEILIKVIVINKLYSTNIIDVKKIANHIHTLNIEEDLKSGKCNLIENMANGHGIIKRKNNKEIRLYSFATKYCHLHEPTKYPIYDSYVAVALENISNQVELDMWQFDKWHEDYKQYKALVDAVILHFNYKQHYKEFDKILWYYGYDLQQLKRKS